MRMLVLGGTQFVGHAFAAEGLARGWEVIAAHRGVPGDVPAGTREVRLDRRAPDAYDALAGERFDVVVDTWSSDPWVVRDAARALGRSADHWVFVSSRSVYSWPPPRGGDESAPVWDGDPDAEAVEYPRDKRGAELAVERELGPGSAVLLRAGLVLGPRDNVGRLPWWLRRIARGGRTLAPDRPGLPIQYVDPRDLAALGLDAAVAGRGGPVDVVCPVGTATLGGLLTACVEATGSDAVLEWVDPAFLLEADVAPWTELPVWLPESEEAYALHTSDVARAIEWGLRIRPLGETVSDCWAWVQQVDAAGTTPPPRDDVGLDPAKEAALLTAWDSRRP